MKEKSKKVKGKSEEGKSFPFPFFLLPSAVSRRLSPTGNTGDAIFHLAISATALLVVLIVIAMIVALASHATLSIRQFGFGFLTGRDWDPIKGARNRRRSYSGAGPRAWRNDGCHDGDWQSAAN